ncbi:MAG: hypothetical protein ACE5MK_01225 [Acidobacteriota bacterium]
MESQLNVSRKRGRGTTKQRAFHIGASDRFSSAYWIHLEAHTQATLSTLDNFLRDLWLECCGHLSAFTLDGVRYEDAFEYLEPDPWDFGPESEDMNIPLDQVLSPGLAFAYEYDFGSTTWLKLRVIEEREGAFPRSPIQLIARNEPLVFECLSCGKPASQVCTCWQWSEEAWYCQECAPEHEGMDHYFLPIVNSPRMGVCGYTG